LRCSQLTRNPKSDIRNLFYSGHVSGIGTIQFKQIRAIGQGQFGQTLLVEDRADDGRLVVMKVPLNKSTELALINELVNTAIQFTSLRKIEHPNIVKYLGISCF